MNSKYEIYGVLKQGHYFRNDFNTPKNLTRKYDMTKANCEVYFDESEFVKLSGSLKLESMEGGTFIVSHTANNPVFYGLRIRDKQTKGDYFYFIEETGRMLANGTEYKLKLNYFATWMEPFLFIDKTKYPNDFFPLENFALKRCHMKNAAMNYRASYALKPSSKGDRWFYILPPETTYYITRNVELLSNRNSVLTLPDELEFDKHEIYSNFGNICGSIEYEGSVGGNVDTTPTKGFITYTTYGSDGYKALIDSMTLKLADIYGSTSHTLKILAESTSLNYVNIDQSGHGLAASQARSASGVRKEANFFLNQCNTDKWFIINKTGTFKSGNSPINYGVKGENNLGLQNVVVAIPLPDRLNDNGQNNFNIYANLLKALSVGVISGQIVKLGSNKFFNTNSGMEVRGLALLDPDNLKITGSGSSTQKGALFGFVIGGNIPDEFLPAIGNSSTNKGEVNPSRELQWWDTSLFQLYASKGMIAGNVQLDKYDVNERRGLLHIDMCAPFIIAQNSIVHDIPYGIAKIEMAKSGSSRTLFEYEVGDPFDKDNKITKYQGKSCYEGYLMTTPMYYLWTVRNGPNELNVDGSLFDGCWTRLLNNNLGNNFVKSMRVPLPFDFDKGPESSTFTVFNEFGSDAMTSITNNGKQGQVGQNAAEIETIEARRDRYTNPFGGLASLIASTFAQGESDNFSKKYDTFDIQTASAELPIQKFRANAIDTINSSGRKLPKGNKDWIVNGYITRASKQWKPSKAMTIANYMILNGWLSTRKIKASLAECLRRTPTQLSSSQFFTYNLHPELASFTVKGDDNTDDDGNKVAGVTNVVPVVINKDFRISSFLLYNEDQFRVAQAINEKERSGQMIVPVKYKQGIYDNLFTSAVQIKGLTSEYPNENPDPRTLTQEMLDNSVLYRGICDVEMKGYGYNYPYEQPQDNQQQTQNQAQAEAEPKANGTASPKRCGRTPRRSPKANSKC